MRHIQRFSLFLLVLPGLVLAEQSGADHRRLAASPGISAGQSQQLSRDPDWRVRRALASNRHTPPPLLELLAHDNNVHVRIAVATNLSSRESTLLLLAQDQSTAVRSVVARFEYVPVSALGLLARDANADIRLEVARNLNASRQILRRLLHDSQPEVASAAAAAWQRQASDADRN
ncbi:MAG: hypothetical protein P8Z75_11450 [Gammaproteobacteria bacterium]|jgi:hypothetical protein